MLLLISVIILVIDVSFVLLNQYLDDQAFQKNIKRQGAEYRLNYDLTLSQTYNSLSTLANYIGHDPKILDTFYRAYIEHNKENTDNNTLAKLRNQLNSSIASSWGNIQQQFLVRQLHFHFGPGSTSFLRVHKPEKFGDNMDTVRHTIVHANQQLVPTQGFETGRVYSGLRSVIPLLYPANGQKHHIGALETGASFEQVLTTLAHKLNVGAAVLLTKQHVEENMWPGSIATHFSNGVLTGCQCFIEATTDDANQDIINDAIEQGIRFKISDTDILLSGGSFYALSHFPIRDFKASNDKRLDAIGAVLIWKNIDKQMATLQRNKKINYIYGAIGFLIIELLFLLGVKHTSNRLNKVINYQTGKIKDKNKQLNQAQQLAHIGSWQLDIPTGKLTWSDEIYHIFEINKQDFEPTYEKFLAVIHPQDREFVDKTYRNSVERRTPYQVVHRLQMPDGRIKYVEERGNSDFDAKNIPLKSSGTVMDITAEHIMREKERLSNKVFKHTKEAIFITDTKSRIIDVNPAFTEITGYQRDEVIGQNPSMFKSGKHDDAFYQNLWKDIQDLGYWQGEIWNKKKSGEIFPELLTISQLNDENGQLEHYIGLFNDITSKKRFEEELMTIAHRDALTGLYNRNAMQENIQRALSYADRTGSPLALLFIDLDGFKIINDDYGHDAGDHVLVSIAKKLLAMCRDTDLCIRLGGDEFLVVYTGVKEQSTIEYLANKVVLTLAEPIPFNEHSLKVGASIGVRIYQPREDKQIDQLIQDADKAMYDAKERGKNQYAIYH